jgi:hypothetical protein
MDRRPASTALHSAGTPSLDAADAEYFKVREVLADGLRTWLTQLPSFAGIALLLHAPLLLVTFLPPLPGPLVVAAFLVGELAVALLVKTALVKAVLDAQRALTSDFTELLEGLRRAPTALAVGVRILVRAAIKLPMVVPGVLYLAETFVAVPAAVAEGTPARKALMRSRNLTHGVKNQVLAICSLIWTVAISLTLLAGVHRPESLTNTTWIVVYLCARALDTSFAAVLSAMTYHHLCERPESD